MLLDNITATLEARTGARRCVGRGSKGSLVGRPLVVAAAGCCCWRAAWGAEHLVSLGHYFFLNYVKEQMLLDIFLPECT